MEGLLEFIKQSTNRLCYFLGIFDLIIIEIFLFMLYLLFINTDIITYIL
jgi:hypothetical protein